MLLSFQEILRWLGLSRPGSRPAGPRKFAIAAVAVSAAMATCACSSIPSSSALPDSRISAASPAGFISFCIRFSDQCKSAGLATIKLTPGEWRAVEDVNAQENQDIKPLDDESHYGRAEYWTIPADGYGDCEDYALAKRRDLIKLGFPARALRMAVVRTQEGAGHAVLTIATDRGDFVLDNLTGAVLPWTDTSYHWITRQSSTDPWQWVSFQTPAPVLTAAIPGASKGASAGGHPNS
jgi:predicted transglutaminase-like cysteine proteinase